MAQFLSSINQYPARASMSWCAALILIGTAALYAVPGCAASAERPLSLLDALFTSTSAACVTGLTVRSTVHDFSTLGQGVILALIQLGGVGIMTVTTFIVVHLTRGGSIRQRKAIAETLGAGEDGNLRQILQNVLTMTVAIETCGFAALAAYNHAFFERYAALGVWSSRTEATWHALFHSVSAFCNAGFALHDRSLIPFADSLVVNGTVCALIVLGGLGFPVINDLWRARRRDRADRWGALQLHTKLMLIGTAALIAAGFAAFLALEHDGVLAHDPPHVMAYKALFHSVTCRTAGFNTVDMPSLTNATLFVSIALMAVGGGPCSTAGGFKVSTAAILVTRAWATFRGFSRVTLFRRTLPASSVDRAGATAMLFFGAAALAVTAMLVVEESGLPHRDAEGRFLEVLFEVISALGTVGLSVDLTPRLSDASRLILVALMFLGRIGPITTFAALSHGGRVEPVEYSSEEPLVG